MEAKFKSLTWDAAKESDGFCSEPHGLEYKYQINNHENGQVKFAILDAHYEFVPGFPELCSSISNAQEKANQHYQSILKNFIN